MSSVARPARGFPLATRIGLVALAVFLCVHVPQTLWRSSRRLKLAWDHRAEDPMVARRRVLGAAYVDGIEGIRRAIAPDGEYFLLRGDDPEREADLWVRYDLAPRRARFLGEAARLRKELLNRGDPRDEPPFAVIAQGRGQAPLVLPTSTLFPAASRPAIEKLEEAPVSILFEP
jgi:hypothetical protein